MYKAQRKIKSPIGNLYLVVSEKSVKGVFFDEQEAPSLQQCPSVLKPSMKKLLDELEAQLKEYFKGQRQDFKLPIDPDGTEFQKKVWKQLLKIPYGKTKSYKDIATAIKDPNASRAVGTANGKNPICVLIPCHRVISADGKLGGYSGGLDKKIKLLSIEKIQYHH